MKAQDSIKHKVTSLALNKMGALEKHTNWVEKLCRDFEAVLSISSEEISFKHGCGVRQGDNLAPMLFVMFMQLVCQPCQTTQPPSLQAGISSPKTTFLFMCLICSVNAITNLQASKLESRPPKPTFLFIV